MSRNSLTDLILVCAVVLGLAIYAGLILRPAWSSYARLWERVTAAFLSLYMLAVLIAVGAAAGLLFVYFWG